MQEAVVVDLFCGAGGLSHGFFLEGFRIAAGIDVDPRCEYPFEANNQALFIREDVEQLTGNDLRSLYPKGSVQILAGCAPCQPFSKYSQRKGVLRTSDWSLLSSFGRLVEEAMPHIVTMENVLPLRKQEVYFQFLERLSLLGFSSAEWDVYCPDYGVPQTRNRLVLLASRLGPLEFIPPTHGSEEYVRVEQVIRDLEPLAAGTASITDPIHCAASLSQINLDRIRAAKPGGSWRDWEPSLLADCHRRPNGRTYPSVYGRMKWDQPAPTITTQCFGFGNGRFGHPEQDRAISLREAAILQTFPPDYSFVAPGEVVEFKPLGRLIGNAVPVKLGRAIAKSIKQHLEGLRCLSTATQ